MCRPFEQMSSLVHRLWKAVSYLILQIYQLSDFTDEGAGSQRSAPGRFSSPGLFPFRACDARETGPAGRRRAVPVCLYSGGITRLLWNIPGSPLPVEPCIPGWEGPSNLICFFYPIHDHGPEFSQTEF